MQDRPISRRSVCTLAFSLLGTTPRALAADVGTPKATQRLRVITLDWAVAETLVALGYPPIGAAEIANYNRAVVTCPMPQGVIDVGLRLSPNPELMQSLCPDVILINSAQEYMRPGLSAFGKVETIPIYTNADQPYRLAGAATMNIARAFGDEQAAIALQTHSTAMMAETCFRLRDYDGRPLYIVSFIDGRHVGVSGRTSLFQGVLDQIGIRNAWQGISGDWGNAIVGIEALAADDSARLVYLSPIPEDARRTLENGPLWRRLPFVRERRVVALPPVWPFGALPTAVRIARLLGDVLAPAQVTSG